MLDPITATFAVGDTVKYKIKTNARPGFAVIKKGTLAKVVEVGERFSKVEVARHGVQELRNDLLVKV